VADHELTTDGVLQRWRANAAAAGVKLTDEDIERISARGFLERVLATEALIARANARNVVPDYLDLLAATSEGRSGHGG
jgi:hypothetical protein